MSIKTSSTYNLQVTEDGNHNVVAMRIEAAIPITLTQNKNLPADKNPVIVPPTANLLIQGDHVTICGKIKTPGRHHTIVSRVLRIIKDPQTHQPPEIDVSGDELDHQQAHPDPSPRVVVANSEGSTGTTISNNPMRDQTRRRDGGPGKSSETHPGDMNGEQGKEGKPGSAAGSVTLYGHVLLDERFPEDEDFDLVLMPPSGVARAYDKEDPP